MRWAPLLLLGLFGCAGELPRGQAPIRRGANEAGMVFDAAVDAEVDAEVDAGIDGGVAPDRAVWLVVRPDHWAEGVRAALDPPQTALDADAQATLDRRPGWPVLVRWAGPAGDALLEALLADEARPVGVLYALRDRAAGLSEDEVPGVAEADFSRLAAQALRSRATLRRDGRALLAIDLDLANAAQRQALTAMQARAETLEVPIAWWLQI
ncbi:MAG: hypothetical protein KC620_13980, partial [Myxococcales bacterium]|nr:hypothetical protein [Myxococcales bacterium]